MTAPLFAEGDYVTLPTRPGWGMGKVLELLEGDKVRVFFEFEGEKRMLGGVLEKTSAPVNHPVLEAVSRSRNVKGFIPFPDLEKAFNKRYKNGFSDPGYLEEERNYKFDASVFHRETLSKEVLAPLMEQGDYATVCKLSKKVLDKINLVFPNEKMAFADGIKKGSEEQRLLAETLFDLLHGEGEFGLRFDAFVNALEELDACKWTVATYFPFLQDPTRHIFVKPSYMKKAAQAYAFEIDYKSRPDWACYEKILAFVDFVGAQLAKRDTLKPRDLIDVQGFIWRSLRED